MDRRAYDARVIVLETELNHVKSELAKVEEIVKDYEIFKTAFNASAGTTKFFAVVIMGLLGVFGAAIAFFFAKVALINKIIGGN